MKHALVFGGSGQIGRPLLGRLLRDGWRVTALSRQPQHDAARTAWLRGDFEALPTLPAQVDVIFSCGPLDAFARWYGASTHRMRARDRVRLDQRRGQARLGRSARTRRRAAPARGRGRRVRRGCGARARTRRCCARRWSTVPAAMPRSPASRSWRSAGAAFRCRATPIGLRQPVHVDDLAAAAFACDRQRRHARPGRMRCRVARRCRIARWSRACSPCWSRRRTLVELPSPLFNIALVGGAS